MRKLTAGLLALALFVSVFAGCSSAAPDASAPAPTDAPDAAVPAAAGTSGELMICIASDPQYMDPARSSSTDGATMTTNAFAGLYGYTGRDENGIMIIEPDCAEAIVEPTELDGGKMQYVITLKEGLKWSDGVEMKASDFTYAWNRAVDPNTMSDYQYIFDVIDGYDPVNPALNITADDAARTVTIVTAALCPYFNELMAFPTFFPVRQDLVEAHPDSLTWSTSAETYISNGAFQMTEWVIGSHITFTKNENYWNADSVKLNTLTFALSDDTDAIFANYESGVYQYMENPPIAQIPVLKETRLGQDFTIGDYAGTYYLEFNVEKSLKPGQDAAGDDWTDWTPAQNAEVRHALSLLVDRNYLVEEVTQAGQIPATGFIPEGMTDGNGKQFRENSPDWWSVAAEDYDANCEQAVEILKKYYTYDDATGMFTDFPTFEYSVNPSSGNLALCAALQNMWADYGIPTSVDQRAWNVIQTALTEGDFSVSRMGWIADYLDPVGFHSIFIKESGNNHPQLGKDGPIGSGAYYGPNGDQTWADTFETTITQIKTTSDLATRADLIYQAEELLRNTYSVIPLYFYTLPYLLNPSVEGMIHTPIGITIFKFASYNV